MPALPERSGPAPPFGVHRYTFLLFQQQPGQAITGPVAEDGTVTRTNFNLRSWAQENGLGEPLAASWFTSTPSQ
jgi:hypothetical protein